MLSDGWEETTEVVGYNVIESKLQGWLRVCLFNSLFRCFFRELFSVFKQLYSFQGKELLPVPYFY